MTKHVLYCLATGVVVEWQDTEQFSYATPSDAVGTLSVTAEQWKQREAPHHVLDGRLALAKPSAATVAAVLPDSVTVVPEQRPIERVATFENLEPAADYRVAVDTPVAEPSQDHREDPSTRERLWRQSILCASQWLVTRHRDEQELGRTTTLSAQQYLELLECRQAMRDWPACDRFPEPAARPDIPVWFEGVSA